MKIAVFSDSHDHVWNMRRAVDAANKAGAETAIHCGDIISPFVLEELDGFGGQVHLVWGNNAGDQGLMMERCLERRGRIRHHGWFGSLEVEGRTLAWLHDPRAAKAMVPSDRFDMVCFGHTHRWFLERRGRTLLLNPGEILGKKGTASWAMVDLATMEVTRMEL